jgi:hypothetical protein
MAIWVTRTGSHDVRRVFRNAIGDWCAEIFDAEGHVRVVVLNHHPRVDAMKLLESRGVDISDDVIAQGAEGEDIRRRGD